MNITSISSGRNILSLAKEIFHFANFVKCWIPIYQKTNINTLMELQCLEKWNARIQTAWVGSDHSKVLSLLEAFFDLISPSSLSMKIQIIGGQITENLGFKSPLRKVKKFCPFFLFIFKFSIKTAYLSF